MKERICIIGSGKMARDIGLFCLKRGGNVVWLAGSADFSASLQRYIAKQAKRMARAGINTPTPRIATLGEAAAVEPADFIIECTAERIDKKRAAVDAVSHMLKNGSSVLLSASSSVLPSAIHERCIGCHFFYPVELSACVEIISQPGAPPHHRDKVRDWLAANGIAAIEQSERNAFAVNRLLLPLQAEAMRLLGERFDARDIDAATVSRFLPIGQFTLMDAVGLDVVLAGAQNYVARMPAPERGGYDVLLGTLRKLVDGGKLGAKNGDGLLCGAPLPQDGITAGAADLSALKNRLYDFFIGTCRQRIACGDITKADLNLALRSIFHAEAELD